MKKIRRLILCAATVAKLRYCIAQHTEEKDKAIFDIEAVRKSKEWPDIIDISLSPDGRFAFYLIGNQPAGSNTLTIWSTGNRWKREIVGASRAIVTKDSRWAIFTRHDSLCLLRLGGYQAEWLPHAGQQYNLVEKGGSWQLICLMGTGSNRDFLCRDISSGTEKKWNGCTGYQLDPDKRKVLWQTVADGKDHITYTLQSMDLADGDVRVLRTGAFAMATDIAWNKAGNVIFYNSLDGQGQDSSYYLHRYDLTAGKDQVIWKHAVKTARFNFDRTGDQVVCLLKDTIWYWRQGSAGAEILATDYTLGLEGKINERSPFFSPDGRRVLFYMIPAKPTATPAGGVKINIWHYRDKVLPPVQVQTVHAYAVALNIDSRKVVRVDQEGERVIMFDQANRYALVERKAAFDEWCWQGPNDMGLYLVSLENGDRQRLPIDIRYINYVVQMSPHEDYVIYYDPVRDGYCSYDIAAGKVHNLTAGLGVSWQEEPYARYFNSANPFFGQSPRPRGITGWTDGDSALLVYDSYDIWKLDPSGSRRPVNMTGGYGRWHHLVFELSLLSHHFAIPSSRAEWILKVFNPVTKQSGFFIKNTGSYAVTPLIMGSYTNVAIRKADIDRTWIFSFTTPCQKGTVCFTRDFKMLTPLLILQPQKDYRWYTTELVNWKLPDGNICQGILYKPEDLDTTRKYPLLFNYYQTASDGIYAFRLPELAEASNINVPWFVSRGYLMFTPDIHYRMGHPGDGALQSVVSAAQYLARRPYVDAGRMGLAGHSWGGTETNYIVTHSHLFAAAAEGAGVTDCIANYNSLSGPGDSRQPLYEIGQSRIGVTLWQRPDLYIENSPILKADRVTTPLLILHNRDDDAVPWSQGVELFTALRRLDKRAWMLEYDGEGHSLRKAENIVDYTIRLTQFFDHYLKGKPAPKWMTEGVPQSMKGIDNGLELDTSGREP